MSALPPFLRNSSIEVKLKKIIMDKYKFDKFKEGLMWLFAAIIALGSGFVITAFLLVLISLDDFLKSFKPLDNSKEDVSKE